MEFKIDAIVKFQPMSKLRLGSTLNWLPKKSEVFRQPLKPI